MNRIEDILLKVLRHWLPYYLLAWVAVVAAAAVAMQYAWHSFDNDRPDGNGGHATIDFGGQYLMGRMLVSGNGRELYNRSVQRYVLHDAYPDDDCKPGDRNDTENMMYWMMGNDDAKARETIAACAAAVPAASADPWQAAGYLLARDDELSETRLERAGARSVGGPLYPPINAFLNAPLALMNPHTSYRVQEWVNLVLVFVAAAGARYLARGRVWWPVLALALMLFPGYGGSLNLGQNATLTVTILVWGWALTARGRPVLGGMVWGLLAFKPVWALSFFLVPLLSGRWRTCLAMVATGAGLALLTLPFVGLHSWLDWLAVGKEAAELYDVDKNWIFLSRDLWSVPRRWLLDFGEAASNDNRLSAMLWADTRWQTPVWLPALLLGWALIGLVLENTVRLAVLRRRQAGAPDGPPAAFLFLGAWMCCYHFMYYDALLASLGLFLLFTEPRRYLAPLLVVLAPLRGAAAGRDVVAYHRAGLPDALPPSVPVDVEPKALWTLNRMAPTAYLLLVMINYLFPYLGSGGHYGTPWDTFCLAGVWLWCGWQWLRHGEKVTTSWEGEPGASATGELPPVADAPGSPSVKQLPSEAGRNGEVAPSPLPAGDAS